MVTESSGRTDNMNKTGNNFRKILIILPRQLGDILLGSSLAFALRSAYPDAKIAWVSDPMGRKLLEGHPALDEVLYYPVLKESSFGQFLQSPFGWLKKIYGYYVSELIFLSRLRRSGYDLVIDSICTPKTAIICYLSGARVRHGIKTRWNRNWAYTWLSNRKQWGAQYAAKARLNLLTPLLGTERVNQPPSEWLNSWIPLPAAAKAKILSLLPELNLKEGDFAVLSPTSRRPLRQWPADAYVNLAFRLIRESGLKICWFWGPGEFEFTESLHRQLQQLLKLSNLEPSLSCMPPLLSLSEAGCMSGLSAVWIGNTNGLSHVAVAGGARTVQIFGPTSAEPWLHPDESMHISVQRQSGCVRCNSNTCKTGTHECMKLLSVDEVYDAVQHIRCSGKK
ncbi:MAG: lipopolysaccharide heptosyltransferase family protein [Proteobacteria bacterium]|nr:lipopolysaccharide heptosyltransferase family protein [Pseudomonadota bacterium]